MQRELAAAEGGGGGGGDIREEREPELEAAAAAGAAAGRLLALEERPVQGGLLLQVKVVAVEGDLVKIALNDSNTNKPKRVDAGEAMGLDAMSKILSSVMASGA